MTWNINQKDDIKYQPRRWHQTYRKKELLQWLSQTKVTFQVTEQGTDLSTYSMMLFCHADQRVVEDAFSLQHCWSRKVWLPVFFHSWNLETTQVTVSKQLHAFGVTVPCSCKPWSKSPPPPPFEYKNNDCNCKYFFTVIYSSLLQFQRISLSFIAYFSQKVVWRCSILIVLSTHLYVISTGVNHHNPQEDHFVQDKLS